MQIGGERFDHRFVHVVLPFSNWEWARVCRSESFLSLKIGLHSALFELGGVPARAIRVPQQRIRREKARRAGSSKRYLGLLAHYGMRAEVIGVGEPQQNGDVESAHHHLRTEIEQGLKMRGTREFASVEDYEIFIYGVLNTRNASQRGEARVGTTQSARCRKRVCPNTRRSGAWSTARGSHEWAARGIRYWRAGLAGVCGRG